MTALAKRKVLGLLALAELLGMTAWFSASAVLPVLTRDWGLSLARQAWLTMAVQLGFVAGSLGSAFLNLADRLPAQRLFAASAFLAAAFTALLPALARGIGAALVLRLLAGVCLAGVYPVGMKIMASWTRDDRGFGIGLLVGALTLGSAAPHLVAAVGGLGRWRLVLYGSSALTALGGWLSASFLREGPFRSPTPRFDWRYAAEIRRSRDLVLANAGYFGHMWELYAMWTWVPAFLLQSFARAGIAAAWASLAAFSAIAVGGAGCLVAGRLADRWGRTAVTIASMAVSGACSLGIGLLAGGNQAWLVIAVLVWGFAVVADSAQFSAATTELCPPERIGTVLTVQTGLGFLLTLVTIRLVPVLERAAGWRWAFAVLAIGPAAGIWAMAALRRLPASIRMAGGRR